MTTRQILYKGRYKPGLFMDLCRAYTGIVAEFDGDDYIIYMYID